MLKITPIYAGTFQLDGGAMFGVVPRRMWAKLNPPDADNMCTWALRCLLVQSPDGRNVLIDTGMGNKQDDKFRSHFLPQDEGALFVSLANAGVSPAAITDVFLTHLHFDHCGGALWRDVATGEVVPAFPNARYWTNQTHYEWALRPNERERASFLKENFVPLHERGILHFVPVEQGYAFLPGFHVRFYYGHTEALMAPVLTTQYGTLVYCADALPSQWHIGMPYVMAYDIRPLVTLEEKAQLLGDAAKYGHILFLEHDPVAEFATVRSDEKGRVVADRVGVLEHYGR
jgi:glyoxylase-like metal-dependent hydrolase (beta-lactamase superfamily II)